MPAKTGESYTAARAMLLRAGNRRVPRTSGWRPSDEKIRQRTGRGWEEWFAMLDGWGAANNPHREIARWVAARLGIEPLARGFRRAALRRIRRKGAARRLPPPSRTIGVPVTDQDRALEFCLDKLRLEKRRDVPVQQLGGRRIEVAPASASDTIALVAVREGAPRGLNSGIRLKTADAAAVHAEFRARGVDVGELLEGRGVPPTFDLHEHDGNRLEIVQAA